MLKFGILRHGSLATEKVGFLYQKRVLLMGFEKAVNPFHISLRNLVFIQR